MFKKILVLAALAIAAGALNPAAAQDRLNPPYPRTGIYCNATGGGGYPQYSSGSWCEKISRYDLALIDGARENGTEFFSRDLRALNPDQILMGMGVNGLWISDPAPFFLYRSYRGKLLEDVKPGQREIKVDTIEGIYSGFDLKSPRFLYIVIGNDIADVSYIADDHTIVIEATDVSRVEAINEFHAAGSTVMSPIRASGPGFFPNLSEYCPVYNGQQSWDYLTEKNLRNKVEIGKNNLDGLFHDYFAKFVYMEKPFTFDFDLNGIDDQDEHSRNWINNRWIYGRDRWLKIERELMNELYPGKPNLLSINAGGTVEEGFFDNLNGHLFEGFLRWGGTSLEGYKYFKFDMEEWIKKGQKPSVNLINDYCPEKWKDDAKEKNDYAKMRFGLATSMIYECYYGMTFGDWYFISFWYDEYDTNMGYPVDTRIIELPNGVMVRYFTKGCVLSNPTGQPQTVAPSQLEGGPYYRLKGGQIPAINSGELVDRPIELWGITYNKNDWRGDGILLFREPTTSVTNIIVDNFNLNDTSPGSKPIEFVGGWTPSLSKGSDDLRGTNPYWCELNMPGINDEVGDQGYGYHFVDQGNGSATATWRPTIGVAGFYEISEWHGWHGDNETSTSEATNVPFEVRVNGEAKLKGSINQRINFGRWNVLGVIRFPSGTNSFVQTNNKADGVVLADAIRFRFLGESVEPDTTPPNPPKNVKILN